MDLRISVVLLLIFLTGGYSLRCFSCKSIMGGPCYATVETCEDRFSKCESITVEQSFGIDKLTATTKQCASPCKPGTQQLEDGVTATTHCCDTNFCNAADGVYKRSFLLLLPSLLFYFLFQ